MTSSTIAITTVTMVKNHLCQPSAPARKLKAAPLLWTSTRLKKGVTSRISPGVNARVTHALVARSARSTARLTPSQRSHRPADGLSIAALLAFALEVGDAARADRRMGGYRAYIGAVVPAALALRVRAHRDLYRERVLAGRLAHRGLGRDQHEA